MDVRQTSAIRANLPGDATTEAQTPISDSMNLRVGSDRIVLYPTFGHPSVDSRSWHVGVSGVVYQPRPDNLRRRMFVRVLQRLMRVHPDQFPGDCFQQRVDGFLVGTERGHRVTVELGGETYEIERPTKRNGHFRGSFQLTRQQAEQLVTGVGIGPGTLHFQASSRLEDPDAASADLAIGSAQLIESTGVSVISDIDDTIKNSEVSDRRRLLQNTFLREFEPVAGMADLYQQWSANGAAFHYVSSSPWQLFVPLHEFAKRCNFPDGSFHLRAIRLRDPSVLRLFVARRATKRRVIRSIVRMFPHRKFILVGDSGEKDPEIYGAIARQYPNRIRRILIRRVEGRSVQPDRIDRAFRDISPNVGKLFDTPDQLALEAEI